MVYAHNDEDTVGDTISAKTIWLMSKWDINGVNTYLYSLEGKDFISFGGESQLRWGSYRGDRIEIYNFNTDQEIGFVDIDWFRYDYSKV